MRHDAYAAASAPPIAHFRYPGRWIYTMAAVILIMFSMAFGILLITSSKGSVAWGLVFLLIFTPFMAALTANAFLRTSDFLIDEEGISRVAFGKVWKRIWWRDVKRIQLYRIPTYTASGPQMQTDFAVYKTYRLFRWNKFRDFIGFTENVNDVELLVSTLNRFAAVWHIPVYSGDRRRSMPLDQIRLEDCVAVMWKKNRKQRWWFG